MRYRRRGLDGSGNRSVDGDDNRAAARYEELDVRTRLLVHLCHRRRGHQHRCRCRRGRRGGRRCGGLLEGQSRGGNLDPSQKLRQLLRKYAALFPQLSDEKAAEDVRLDADDLAGVRFFCVPFLFLAAASLKQPNL